jgi:hypothetical protein
MGQLTVFILDRVANNYPASAPDPDPTLYNEDDGSVRGEAPEREPDLTDGAPIVTANQTPAVDRQPIGTEFDYRVEPGVSVRVEGLREDVRGGTLADDVEFGKVVSGVQAAINSARTFPDPGDADVDYLSATIENDTPQSANRPAGYYERTFDVRFRGYQDV